MDETDWGERPRRNRLVVIGRQLDRGRGVRAWDEVCSARARFSREQARSYGTVRQAQAPRPIAMAMRDD